MTGTQINISLVTVARPSDTRYPATTFEDEHVLKMNRPSDRLHELSINAEKLYKHNKFSLKRRFPSLAVTLTSRRSFNLI